MLFTRHLQGEIAEEYAIQRADGSPASAALIDLALAIVPYCMRHNAEAEACDLLMEVCIPFHIYIMCVIVDIHFSGFSL